MAKKDSVVVEQEFKLQPDDTIRLLMEHPLYANLGAHLHPLRIERSTLSMQLMRRAGIKLGPLTLGHHMPKGQIALYEKRIATIDEELARADHIAAIIAAGYDPYTAPANWYVGWIHGEAPTPKSFMRGESYEVVRTFIGPIPPDVLDKLDTAHHSGLFKDFLVASPHADHFTTARGREIVPRSMWLDPVLIGTVNKAIVPHQHNGGYDGSNPFFTYGFMIAQWDLAKDLALLPQFAKSGL